MRDVQILPTVSLFCGCGGLDEGFRQAGFSPVLAIDLNRASCRTFQLNHSNCRVVTANLAKVDSSYVVERLAELPTLVRPVGVVGGPPCQAFSRGNVWKKSTDPRRLLPRVYAREIGKLNAEYGLDFFVFENVVGLTHKDHSDVMKDVRALFRKAGFKIFEAELDAADFGVPQIRRRVFIVGFNKKKYPELQFCFPKRRSGKRRTVRDVLKDLPAPKRFKRGLTTELIDLHPNHWCMKPRSSKFLNGELKAGSSNGRPFRVLHWDKPSWTVAYGHREVHVHPSGKRRLSVYEAMLLQGFPKHYELLGNLSEQIRQISDAVPPPLGKAIAVEIRKALKGMELSEEGDSRRGRQTRAVSR